MTTTRLISKLIPLMAMMAGFLSAQPASPAQDPSNAPLGTIKQYCVACHNDRAKTGGFSFQGITPDSISKDPKLFEKAVMKLRGRVMPPPGARQPDGKSVESLVAWLES